MAFRLRSRQVMWGMATSPSSRRSLQAVRLASTRARAMGQSAMVSASHPGLLQPPGAGHIAGQVGVRGLVQLHRDHTAPPGPACAGKGSETAGRIWASGCGLELRSRKWGMGVSLQSLPQRRDVGGSRAAAPSPG